MKIIDTPVIAAENPYDQDVLDLIAAGEGKSATYDVEKGELNDKGESKALTSLKLKFQRAANAQDKTARSLILNDDGTTVTIAFTLRPKQKGRGDKSPEAVETVTDAAPEADENRKPNGK